MMGIRMVKNEYGRNVAITDEMIQTLPTWAIQYIEKLKNARESSILAMEQYEIESRKSWMAADNLRRELSRARSTIVELKSQ